LLKRETLAYFVDVQAELGHPEEFVLVAELVVYGELHHSQDSFLVCFAEERATVANVRHVQLASIN